MPSLNILKYTARSLLFLTLFSIGLKSGSIQAQETETIPEAVPEAVPENVEQPDSDIPPSSIFSIEGGEKLMEEADRAIDAQDYELATQKLQSARQVFNQLSNFYLQLFNGTSQLDNVAADSHRQKALDTGIKRDEATYQLALVHRAQNKSELSIPLLIQVINSQSPGIGLGKKAYDQLLEIGFVDVPITIPKAGSTPPQNTPQPTPNPQTLPEGSQPTVPNPTVPNPGNPNP